MRMTPIIINKINFISVEASIKYFIVQSISSLILIFSSLVRQIPQGWGVLLNLDDIYFLCLALKTGVAPLHFWLPQVILSCEWIQCIILLTWQKIAPFFLMSYLKSPLILIFIVLSALIGALGGINQINLKIILVYSSIINSSWILSLSYINELTWWAYFLAYSIITCSASYLFIIFNIQKITSLHKINLPLGPKISFTINFFSLAGLPPFLGFFIKITSINSLLENNFNLFIILVMVISSFFSFYFYSRLIYASLFLNERTNLIKSINEPPLASSKTIYLISIISSLGIIVSPILVLLT